MPHSNLSSLYNDLRAHAKNMRPTTPRKVLLLYHMSSPTKKMHVQANREGRFTDLERIYSYSFVIPVKYIIFNSFHLARKYARIFVRGHSSVPRREHLSESVARGKL